MITGFPSETEEDHQDTLSLMKEIQYDYGYMYAYSERPGHSRQLGIWQTTFLQEVKNRRLTEIIALQRDIVILEANKQLGKTVEVLIEGASKKFRFGLDGPKLSKFCCGIS